MKCLVLGGSSVDTLIHVPSINSIEEDMSIWAEKVVETIGGTGAGKALSLDALGNEVTFVTNLGPDKEREKIKSFFLKTNVNLLPVETDNTTTHTNIMHSKGKRISIFTSVSKKIPAIVPNIEEILNNVDVVFLNINEFCRGYIPILKEHNIPIVVDIHDYNPPNPYHKDFIEAADIITGSGVYIKNQNQFLEELIDEGKEVAILTNGSKGLIAMDQRKNVHILNGYTEFEYVDSNGAGDSFCSGFVTEYMKSKNVGESLKIGTLAGAFACTTYDLYNVNYTYKKLNEIKKRVDF